jgi:hypothetical protein
MFRRLPVLLSFASIALSLGCGEGPTMRPGENCLAGCHDGSDNGPKLSLAGTVFGAPDASVSDGLAGAKVIITDSNFVETTLVANEVGNFYTSKTLSPPLTVAVEWKGKRSTMGTPLTSATIGCGVCHADPPDGGAPGRIYPMP